jgi:hypothetical protein
MIRSDPAGKSTAMSRAAREVVLGELERVFSSDPFRESPRCQEFLRYVVEMAIDGREEQLKERTIGIGVFGRDPGYNTNDDSIVRVKASEVRRRLAQYNMVRHEDQRVRIHLAPGSYVPEFLWVAGVEPQSTRTAVPRRLLWAAAALIVVAVAILLVRYRTGYRSAHEEFWAPVLAGPDPVMVCMAQPGGVYRLSFRLLNGPQETAGWAPEPDPAALPELPAKVDPSDILVARDQYTAVGTALAAVNIATLLKGAGKTSQVRIAEDVSFSELRRFTTILIGGPRANKWTREMAGEMRFTFMRRDGRPAVHDRLNEQASWTPPRIEDSGKVAEDYAIVSRVFDAKSGQIVIAAGGITHYGTQAAAEFLVNPECLARATTGLPADWPRRNVQFLLKTSVVGASVTTPTLVAAHAW